MLEDDLAEPRPDVKELCKLMKLEKLPDFALEELILDRADVSASATEALSVDCQVPSQFGADETLALVSGLENRVAALKVSHEEMDLNSGTAFHKLATRVAALKWSHADDVGGLARSVRLHEDDFADVKSSLASAFGAIAGSCGAVCGADGRADG